jgi:hypothetical protein
MDVATQLFELFRADFEMFGYDAKEYLDLAVSKQTSTTVCSKEEVKKCLLIS